MVTVLELGLLRILNKKNSDRTLEFPVRAFSALTEFSELSIEEIAEVTELDNEIMQPVVQRLLKQRILVMPRQSRIAINRDLHSIHKMISEA